jgi:hypothetical protein
MQGLGDNLYQRAVLQSVKAEVWLKTSWPQIYADMPTVKCVRPITRLRTQAKNVDRSTFARPAPMATAKRWHYVSDPSISILESLARQMQVPTPSGMDGPRFGLPKLVDGPYIVVRPACVRSEWTSDSRNPLPEYIAEAIEALRDRFAIVSVADLEEGKEWALDPLPYADLTLHRGELKVEQLLSLVENAAGLVGGVGWIVPAALSYRVPLLLIYGGWGLSNSPSRIIGNLDSSFIEQAVPDVFCMCNNNRHACDKRIADFAVRARAFADGLVPRPDVDAAAWDRVVSSQGESLRSRVLGEVQSL